MLKQTTLFTLLNVAFRLASSVVKIRHGDPQNLATLGVADVCKSDIFWGFYVAEFYAKFLDVGSYSDCVLLCSRDPDCLSTNYVAEKRTPSSVNVCLLSRYKHHYFYKPASNGRPFQTCGVSAFDNADDAPTSRQTRIMGGARAKPFSQPWIGQIVKRGSNHCGVSLIGRKDDVDETIWAISAAHCFRKRFDLGVALHRYSLIFGVHDLRYATPHIVYRNIEKIVIHEDYDFKNIDIVLIRIENSIKFNDFIRPICLPIKTTVKKSLSAPCSVCGYGIFTDKSTDSSKVLKCMMTKLEGKIPETSIFVMWNIQSSTYSVSWSTRYKGPDSGDSGGPATCKNDRKSYLFGLTYAKAIANSKFDFSLGIYLHVPIFVDWILKKMTKEEKVFFDNARKSQHQTQVGQSNSQNRICWPRSFPKGCLGRN